METKRLILRRWNENDAEALYKYAQNPNIGPIAGWPPHTSVEDSKNVIRNILSAPETYAVVLKETQEPIGSVGIMFGDSVHSADMQEGDAEIGYWIGVPYWGKGLIPEAVHRLLEHCFEDLGIKRVWCGYYDGNFKSRRVMDKCGVSRNFVGIIFYTRKVLLTSHYEKRLFEYASQPRVAGSDIRLLSYLWS